MEDLSRPKNVPNLMLRVLRYLVANGFGSLRFYSYVKEGLNTLRVVWYFEMQERGRKGEPLAYHLWSESFASTDSYGVASSWKSCIQGDYPVEDAIQIIKDKLSLYADYQSKPPAEYLEWLDELLATCGNNGIPITEEPHLHGYGEEGNLVECVFDDRSRVAYLPRPQMFCETIFPYLEHSKWVRRRDAETAEARRKDNYGEWKRRVSGILNGEIPS